MPKNRNSASAPAVAVVAPATEQTAPKPLRPRGSRVMVARSMFSGPMPPPELVREYEQILPGAAQYFFAALERQSLHRQQLEQNVISANISNERTGMWLAFALAVIAMVSGTLLIHENRDPQGLSLIVGTMVSLCAVFVYSRTRARREVREKSPETAVAP